MKDSSVGELASLARRRLGLNQTEMAKRLGIERTYLSALENDRRTPSDELRERILSIAQSANVDIPNTFAPMVQEMRSRFGRQSSPGRDGVKSQFAPTRTEIEEHLTAYLDAAEKAKGGIGYAYGQVKRNLRIEDFDEM